MDAELVVANQEHVLSVVFNRPQARNALTWTMYEDLKAAAEQADDDDNIRVLTIRGAGTDAFAAGTDINQFAELSTGHEGLAYEAKIAALINRLEEVTVPTVAAVSGHCVGAGLAIAAVCDLRLATHSAKFGLPVARTLGICLSMNTYSLLRDRLGSSRLVDMILRGQVLTGQSARDCGFVSALCEDDQLDALVAETVQTLLGHAPLTMWATKEAMLRIRRANLPDGDDIVERVFGSDDFRAGVQAFNRKERAIWAGQ
jgi:enoyl-CoA hydratase/carnithine racemase